MNPGYEYLILEEFRMDMMVWHDFARSDRSQEDQVLYERGIWHKTSVLQYECAMDSVPDEADKVPREIKVQASTMLRLKLSTLPVEEIIGTEKADKGISKSRAFKRPEVAYASAIKGGCGDRK